MFPTRRCSLSCRRQEVHQLIKSFLQTETAEQSVKQIAKKQNGRVDMEALRNYYSGKGNTSRQIAVAERIRDTLFYNTILTSSRHLYQDLFLGHELFMLL
jgi:hypothetical protein